MQGGQPRADHADGAPRSLGGSLLVGLALASLTAMLLVTVNVLSAESVTARIGLGGDERPVLVAAREAVPITRVRAPAAPVSIAPASPPARSAIEVTQPSASEPDLLAIAEWQSRWFAAQLELARRLPAPQSPPTAAAAPAPTAAPTAAATPVATPRPAATAAPVAATPAPAQVAPAPAPVATLALSAREIGLLEAMNRERAANGLAPLQASGPLLPIARARSEDMSLNGYFAHFSPTGESVYTLTAAAGLRFSALGENLARVSGDELRSVSVAIDKLMLSPPHRANILNAAYTHVGVGAVTDDRNVTVFTTVFAGS